MASPLAPGQPKTTTRPAPAASRGADTLTPRDAVREDLERIGAIFNEEIISGTASWTVTPRSPADMAAWFAEKQAAGLPLLVMGTPAVAFATWGPFRRGEGYAGVAEHTVYVDATARGRGIGRAMLDALIARARAAGLRHLVGGIDAGQAASLALHRGAGFVEMGRLPGIGVKFGAPRTLVLVQRALEEGA